MGPLQRRDRRRRPRARSADYEGSVARSLDARVPDRSVLRGPRESAGSGAVPDRTRRRSAPLNRPARRNGARSRLRGDGPAADGDALREVERVGGGGGGGGGGASAGAARGPPPLAGA